MCGRLASNVITIYSNDIFDSNSFANNLTIMHKNEILFKLMDFNNFLELDFSYNKNHGC
jgi:hypothetical protein